MPNRDGINLTNPITIVDKSLNKNAFWSDEGVGGLHQKDTLIERNNIVPARRVEGLLCYVSETGKYYKLKPNYSTVNELLLDTDWEELSTGTGQVPIYTFANGLTTVTAPNGVDKTVSIGAGTSDRLTSELLFILNETQGNNSIYTTTVLGNQLSLTYFNSGEKSTVLSPSTLSLSFTNNINYTVSSLKMNSTGDLVLTDANANSSNPITLSQLWNRGSVGGTDKQIQYNDNNVLGGFGIYDKTYTNLTLGTKAKAYRKSQVVKGNGSFDTVKGTAQISEDSVYIATTDATPTKLKIDTDILSISNNQTTISAHINIACYNATSNLSAGWLFWGVFKRDNSGAVSLVGTPMLLAERKETGMESTNVSINTVNKEINILVTGLASTNIRWHAGLHSSEVSYNEPSYVTPINYTYGRLYNWYAASSRSYGMLYNWYAATDIRNIAPVGWHVPSKAEYDTLIAYLGGSSVAGGKLKEIGTTYWGSPNTGATNETGFNAILVSYRESYGSFVGTNVTQFRNSSDNSLLRVCEGYAYVDYTSTVSAYNKVGASIRLIKDNSTDTGIMTGNDGKQYPTVKIDWGSGSQVWLAQNLEETKFRDGSTIPIVTDNTAWSNLTTAGACWYNNTRTYDLAPVGWHLPSDTEYTTLKTYLGGYTIAGGKLKSTDTSAWSSPNTGATNITGFTALGTGARHNVFNFAWSGQYSYIATTNPVDPYLLYYNSTQFEKGDGVASIGCCVRFIRNINSVLTTQPVDAEGNVYETVTIGTQTYTKQNHKSKKWRTGENINVQDIYTNSAWTALTIPACCAYNNDENNV